MLLPLESGIDTSSRHERIPAICAEAQHRAARIAHSLYGADPQDMRHNPVFHPDHLPTNGHTCPMSNVHRSQLRAEPTPKLPDGEPLFCAEPAPHPRPDAPFRTPCAPAL